MDFSLNGKIALITGASRGIGQAAAIGMARAGADIAIASRKLPDLEKVAEEVRKTGRKCLPVAAHVARMEEINDLVRRVMEEFGRIDILVNDAAANFNAMILDLSIKRWDLMMRVNLRGTFICTKAVLPTMVAQRSGNIICLTSPAAKRRAPPGEVCYSITKAGIELFCWGLAQEVSQHNIAVNDLYPEGAVATEGFKAVFKNVHNAPRQVKTPEEIAEAALWLAMQDASTFTGHSVSDEEVKRYIKGQAKP
jgi:3-oxoacyl-[acyl-carrier protein] reductase